jgi:cell division protein FtsZ
MQAAEAAISNPLLDESSMRGAGGLLISITGGRDLTLFEVDEAATRIREEVDEEANIILGATFDENLEGVIRVSVVATGIDNAANRAERLAPVTRTEAITRSAPVKAAEPAAEKVAPTVAQSSTSFAQRIQRTAASMEIPEPAKKVERDGVTLEPFKPALESFSDPDVEAEFKAALESELMPDGEAFIPPAAQEPAGTPQPVTSAPIAGAPLVSRPPVQAPVAAQAHAPAAPNHGPMGLLNKLKSSFGAREEAFERKEPMPTMAPMPRPAAHETPKPAAQTEDPFAPKRSAVDSHGRVNPSERPASQDDQLDIPAFLRRQAN